MSANTGTPRNIPRIPNRDPPTETENRETLEGLVAMLEDIVKNGRENPQTLLDAPIHTPVRRLDETAAARQMILTEDMAK